MASNNRNSQQRRPAQDANDRNRNPALGQRAQQPSIGSAYAKRRVDTRKVQETLNEMFANVFDAEVIRSVGQACSWKLNKSIEALIMLSEDNDPQPVKMTPGLGHSVIPSCLSADNATGINTLTPSKRNSQGSDRQYSSSEVMHNAFSKNCRRSKSVMMNAGQGTIKVTYKSYNNSNAGADEADDDDDDDADIVVEEENEIDVSSHDMPFVGAASQSVCQFVSPVVPHNLHRVNDLSFPAGSVLETQLAPSPAPRRLPMKAPNLTMPETPGTPEVPSSSVRKTKHFSKLDKVKKQIFGGIKVMVLMRGCPGSGKSTFARHIIKVTWGNENHRRYVFSTDDYFAVSGKYSFVPRLLSDAHAWNQQRVLEAARGGVNPIVVDNTNIQYWEMQPYATIAVKFGYSLELLEPRTSWRNNPFELARKTIHKVPRPTIDKMLMRFDHDLTSRALLDLLKLQYPANAKPPQRAAQRPGHPPALHVQKLDKKKNKAKKDIPKHEKSLKTPGKSQPKKQNQKPQNIPKHSVKLMEPLSYSPSQEEQEQSCSLFMAGDSCVCDVAERSDAHLPVGGTKASLSSEGDSTSDRDEVSLSSSDAEEAGDWEDESIGELEDDEDCLHLLESTEEEHKHAAQTAVRAEPEDNSHDYALVLDDGTLLTRKPYRRACDYNQPSDPEPCRAWEYLLMTDDSGLLLQQRQRQVEEVRSRGRTGSVSTMGGDGEDPLGSAARGAECRDAPANKLDIFEEVPVIDSTSVVCESESNESCSGTPSQPSLSYLSELLHIDGSALYKESGEPCTESVGSEQKPPAQAVQKVDKAADIRDETDHIGTAGGQSERLALQPENTDSTSSVEIPTEFLYGPPANKALAELTKNDDGDEDEKKRLTTSRQIGYKGADALKLRARELFGLTDDEISKQSNKRKNGDTMSENTNALESTSGGSECGSDLLDLPSDPPIGSDLDNCALWQSGRIVTEHPELKSVAQHYEDCFGKVVPEAGTGNKMLRMSPVESDLKHIEQAGLSQVANASSTGNSILSEDQANGHVHCEYSALQKWEMSKASWDAEDTAETASAGEKDKRDESSPKPARASRRLAPNTPERIVLSCGADNEREDPVADAWTTWEQHNAAAPVDDKPAGSTSPQPQRKVFSVSVEAKDGRSSTGRQQTAALTADMSGKEHTEENTHDASENGAQEVSESHGKDKHMQTPVNSEGSLAGLVHKTEPLVETHTHSEQPLGFFEEKETPGEKVCAETNTHHSDFILLGNINAGAGTEEMNVTVKPAFSRNISSEEEPRRTPQQFGMFDKSSMTVDTASTHPEDRNVSEQVEELVRMFPHCSVDDLQEIHERCNLDINWTVDLLLESQSQGIELSTARGLPVQFDRGAAGSGLDEELPATEHAAKPPALLKRNGRRDRSTVSEESLLLKRMVEETIVINDEHYSDHVSRIRKLRHGEADAAAEQEAEGGWPTAGSAHALRPDAPEWGAAEPDLSEPWLDEEEEVAVMGLTLDGSLADQLHEMFGTAGLPFKEETKPTVTIPLALARQLHYYLMEAQQNTYELMMQEDEELARGLQEQERQESERVATLGAAEAAAGAETVMGSSQVPDLREIMDMEMALAFYKADQKQCRGEGRDDLATKLTKNLLCEWFPSLPRDVLMDVFEAHEHSFDQTLEVLLASTGGDQGVRTVLSPEARAAQERALIERASQESQKHSEYWRASQADEGDLLSPEQALEEATRHREEASRHYSLRSECQQRAQRAYQKGLTAVAAYYSQMASLHKQRIEDSNARATSSLLLVHTLGKPSSTLDLHFLYVAEALQVLDVFLDHHLRQLASCSRRSAHVFIITGRGARSSGGRSRIKPAVEQRLEQRSLRYAEMNPGLLKVVLTKSSLLSSALLSGGN